MRNGLSTFLNRLRTLLIILTWVDERMGGDVDSIAYDPLVSTVADAVLWRS